MTKQLYLIGVYDERLPLFTTDVKQCASCHKPGFSVFGVSIGEPLDNGLLRKEYVDEINKKVSRSGLVMFGDDDTHVCTKCTLARVCYFCKHEYEFTKENFYAAARLLSEHPGGDAKYIFICTDCADEHGKVLLDLMSKDLLKDVHSVE